MKIGICTGGGDCPGLNAAIRAVVKHARLSYQAEVYGIYDSFNGLQERPLRYKKLGNSDVVDILNRGGTILGTYNKGTNFKTAEGQEKVRLTLEGFKQLGLDGLIVIGGEGTQTLAQYLTDAGLPIIGMPKTIDNDLPATEQTIGFSTCMHLVAESLQRLRSTAESHDRVMILEVMGRDSGFIALHGGIAGGANIILIPEIPFDYEKIFAKIAFRKSLGRNFSLVVVSEGAKENGGSPIFNAHITDKQNLGGIGQMLAYKLAAMSGMEARVTVLGHLQRGGAPNAEDKLLATRFAIHAVDLAAKGQWGRVVVLQANRVTDVAYKAIARYERRTLPLDDSLITAAESIGICLGR